MGRIRFAVNFEVKLKRKLEEFLGRYQAEIGFRILELKIEKYWKLEGQFQAKFFIETDSVEKEQQVYEVLIMAKKLWSPGYMNWTFNGPYDDENLDFECYLNNENDDQPLKWAHLRLENEG